MKSQQNTVAHTSQQRKLNKTKTAAQQCLAARDFIALASPVIGLEAYNRKHSWLVLDLSDQILTFGHKQRIYINPSAKLGENSESCLNEFNPKKDLSRSQTCTVQWSQMSV